jgi:glycosyltransferase involved in cell wall biosynthesis
MPAKVGFILKGYPRLSETFIAQEIHLLEQRGIELEIYSMRAARDKVRHPVHDKIRASVTYVPEAGFLKPSVWGPCLRTFTHFPLSFLGALGHALFISARRLTLGPLQRLVQAGWLIQKNKLKLGSTVQHLHSHFVHAPTEMAFYLAKITGLTFSISAHAKDIYTSSEEEIRERVRASQFLMTCTKFNHQRIQEIVGPLHKDKVHEVYHGVDLRSFRREAGSLPVFPLPRLLTVARLVDKKGYDDVFRAIVILKSRGLVLRYDIYGEGEERNSLTRLAAELGLAEQVHFYGSVSQPVVLAAYREGGVFVLGSRETENGDRDGIPNSMAEAMSMELPVVATLVSGIPELVEHERTGLLVSPRDPAAMAGAIERLYREPGLGARLGAGAREKVGRVFDADICIDRCANLLLPFVGPARD